MKKMLIGAVAALTAGASLAAAVPASAQPYRGSNHYGHRNNSGAVVAAGIAGLAIGAALAGNHNDGYYGYGYGPRYYRSYPAYGYGYGYGYAYRCRTELRWNWRWGDYERIRICR